MKHEYMTRSGPKRALQTFADVFFDLYAYALVRDRGSSEKISKDSKLLAISLGHLGDALLLSYIFPVVKKKFPQITINVLVGEWCRPLFKNNSYVQEVLTFNHVRTNRVHRSLLLRGRSHLQTFPGALDQIRSKKFDFSFEGRLHYPNGNLISYLGRVRNRIGFGSGGAGGLLTKEVRIPRKAAFHLLEAVCGELQEVGAEVQFEEIQPQYSPSTEPIGDGALGTLLERDAIHFVLISPECGNRVRQLSWKFWEMVCGTILEETDWQVVITGLAMQTSSFADRMGVAFSRRSARVFNLVGKTTIDDLFHMSMRAIVSITGDSFPAHLCAIGSETICIFKNGSGSLYFPLPTKRATVIHNHAQSRDAHIHPKLINAYFNMLESPRVIQYIRDKIREIQAQR
jgi:heptosyltransferase-3